MDKVKEAVKRYAYLIKKYRSLNIVELADFDAAMILKHENLIWMIKQCNDDMYYTWLTDLGWEYYCLMFGLDSWDDELALLLFKYWNWRPLSYSDIEKLKEYGKEGYFEFNIHKKCFFRQGKASEEGREYLNEYSEEEKQINIIFTEGEIVKIA